MSLLREGLTTGMKQDLRVCFFVTDNVFWILRNGRMGGAEGTYWILGTQQRKAPIDHKQLRLSMKVVNWSPLVASSVDPGSRVLDGLKGFIELV